MAAAAAEHGPHEAETTSQPTMVATADEHGSHQADSQPLLEPAMAAASDEQGPPDAETQPLPQPTTAAAVDEHGPHEAETPTPLQQTMADSAAADQSHPSETLPLVVIHRVPCYSLPFIASLKAKYTVLDPHGDPPDSSFSDLSKSARVIICVGPTPLTSDDLDRYPAVECVVGSSAAINHFDLAACRRRGIRVTNAGDTFSDDVADIAVGLAIDVLRRISTADRFVRTGCWPLQKDHILGAKVSGKRVGILGFGSIGSRIAKRLEAFGCSIAYNSRKKKPHVSHPFYANIRDLASRSDILILCCALTKETHHIINKDVLKRLGKKGVIVNVGRGALIDEKELVGFLLRCEIGGAGLDVFEDEPNVPQDLFTLENVVLSPHRGAFTPESFAALEELIMGNLEAFFSDKPLQAQVELD